jgi:hypothetical protein
MSSRDIANLKNGLVAAWIPSLGSTGYRLVDRVGSNHGVLTNMDAGSDWVVSGGALSLDFDGTDDYLDCGDASILRLQSSSWTVSFWAKPAIRNQYQAFVAHDSNVTQQPLYEIGISNGNKLYYFDGTNNPEGAVFTNTWTHCVVTSTGSSGTASVRLYQNGLQTGSGNGLVFGASRGQRLRIAVDAESGVGQQAYLQGQMDDIRIYNRALTATEVSLLSKERGIGFKRAARSAFAEPISYKPPKDKTYAAITRSQSDYDSLREGLVLAICPSVSGATGYRAVDVSGRGNHGTLTNMEPEDWVSSNGVALDFNAATERVVVANKREFQFDNASRFSVSVWLYNKGSSGLTFPHVCTGQGSNNNFAWGIEVNASTNAINYFVAKAFVNTVGVSASASTNQWIHAVLVYDGSQVTGYKDGVAISSASWTLGTVSASDLDIWVGNQKDDTAGRRFNGSVDDFRVYNRVLTPAEIRRLASGRGVGLKPTSTQFDYLETREKTYSVIVKSQQEHSSLSEGLVGAWCPSLGATGFRLIDRSGYGNHGVLTGMDAATDWVVSGGAGALDFDGTNDYVGSFPRIISEPQKPRTISAWIRPSSTNRGGIAGTRVNNGWVFTINRTAAGNLTYFHAAVGTVETAAGITVNTWQHVAVTWDGAKCTLYKSGELLTTSALNAEIVDNTNGFIGTEQVGQGVDFHGMLDDIRIYNRALTPAEIRQLASERGIGLRSQKQTMFYQFPSGSKRRRLLTGMP